MVLEICANSVTSALAAQAGGGQRVELCSNLAEGGTTPSYGEMATSRRLLHINMYVLIRPRPGDFVYSELEYQIMLADVQQAIALGCDGIAIGILNPDGSVDVARCRTLVDMALYAGLGVTFHRAFDAVPDQFSALEALIELGCQRILTSGGQVTALQGAEQIASLIEAAAGRIMLMPGAGINPGNIVQLKQITGASEFHTSARITVDKGIPSIHPELHFGQAPELTDVRQVEQLTKLLKESQE